MPATVVKLTDALRDEYQRLFDQCAVLPQRATEVTGLIRTLMRNQARYEGAGAAVGVPWYWVAVVHNMESSQNFSTHLHNGDPLSARTVQWPSGRPKTGTPPFTWEQSAQDALTLKGLDSWSDWTVAGMLFQLERYNGFGYRLHHPEVKSPYLWSGSNHYTSGKYVKDGVWSPTAVSRQVGAAVLLRRMAETGAIDLPSHGLPAVVMRALEREQPLLRWSRSGPVPYAAQLQQFLNGFPGIYVKVDGYPGDKTSDAFRQVTGRYLAGDPRGADA